MQTAVVALPAAPAAPRRTWTVGLGVAVVLLAVYLCTMLPGTGFSGDSAKFAYIGRVLGTPHNTGYPTYVLLNAAWVRLVPLGDLAWRANLLSAVLAAAAGGLLVDVLVWASVRRTVAAATALAFGFTITLWTQAVVAEVYSLHILALVAVLDLLLRWQAERRDGLLLGAAAVVAVSLGHHLMIVLALPGIAAFVLAVDRRAVLRGRLVAAAALLVVVGLSPYGFVLWRTANPSPTTYLQSSASDVGELVDVVRGEEFESDLFEFPLDHVLDVRVRNVREYLAGEWSWLVAVSALGAALAWRRPLTWLLALWVLFDVVFVLNYGVIDVQVFMLPTYLCLAVWAAVGLEAVVARSGPLRPLALAAACAVPVALLAWNYRTVDASKNVAEAAAVERALAAVPAGAVVVAPGYEARQFAAYHLLGEGLGRRRDLVLAPPSLRRVADYLRRDQPLLAPGGTPVAPGRPVVALDPEATGDDAVQLGLAVDPLAGGLARLVPAQGGEQSALR